MVREQNQRDNLFKNHPTIETNEINENDNKYESELDNLIHCQFCNKICYISYVQNYRNQSISCLEHYEQVKI